MKTYLSCVTCKKQFLPTEIRYRCDCGETLEVVSDKTTTTANEYKKTLRDRHLSDDPVNKSGVWRYRELVYGVLESHAVTRGEGNTNLYHVGSDEKTGMGKIGAYVGVNTMYLKHEGENPTGSFKDRGMAAGIAKAREIGARAVACASTGNTSASLASYAAASGLACFVFVPAGNIALGKLSQALAYNAITIQINGDFDKALSITQEICTKHNIYLLNSINPFRIEGQKTIAIELLEQLNWNAPDWIVLPGGNLGNTAAIGKALIELKQANLIDKLPKIATIQAKGASPFHQSYQSKFKKQVRVTANTRATAIKIGDPVSILKAQQAIEKTNGVVESVTDQEIFDAKAIIDQSGIGCEPASATTVAGIKKLINANVIKKTDSVAGILTGHLLKDPDNTISYHQDRIPGIRARYKNILHEAKTDLSEIETIIKKTLS